MKEVRCDRTGEAEACDSCDHGHDHEIIPFRCHTKRGDWFACPSTNMVVHCNPIPAPTPATRAELANNSNLSTLKLLDIHPRMWYN